MRVLVFFDSYNLGGAEKHALKLADYFKNGRGYETEVWVMERGSGGDEKVLQFCQARNIPTKIIGSTGRLQRFLFYKQIAHYAPIFKAFRPDVIISFNLIPNLINGLVKPFCGARCSVWSQQSVINYQNDSWIDRKAISNISCFISNSHHGLAKLQQRFSLPADHCFVVPNGIEEPLPQASAAQWLDKIGVKEQDFKAVMTANLHSTKDHLTLIRAWKIVVDKLSAQGRKPYLILPGRFGNTTQTILDEIFALNIYPYVKLLGSVNDIDGLNTAMDLGILSSPAEGMPNGLMENMKAGMAVVGTDIDGIKEVVGEDNYRFLSPVKDVVKMAENILWLAEHNEERKVIALRNQERMNSHFLLDKMCSDTEAIIQRFL